jgi:hypothetical protein
MGETIQLGWPKDSKSKEPADKHGTVWLKPTGKCEILFDEHRGRLLSFKSTNHFELRLPRGTIMQERAASLKVLDRQRSR